MRFGIFGIDVTAGTFAIAALGYFCWELGHLWFAMRSEFWPYVLGTVEEVDIDNRRDSDGDDFFVPRVRYVYRVGGESYVGKRLAFRPKGSAHHQAVVAALEGVTASKHHRVYFHPRHPQLSVLKPGPGLINYVVLVVVFVILCFAFYAHTTTR
jgi:hypothetical protein